MNPAQRRKIKMQQRQAKKIAALRKERQAALKKQQLRNQPSPAGRRQKPRQQHVSNPLPKPDIDSTQWNQEAYIVGGGPSLMGFDWKNLDGKFVIGINRAYEVLPNAQIIYFTDNDYWQRHANEMKKHSGMLCRGRIARRPDITDERVTEFQLQAHPSGWSDQYGELFHGSNSTFACIQLAYQLGFNKIYLLGIDMKHQGAYVRNKKNNLGVTHWHSGHRRTDPANAYKMFMAHYAKMVPEAKKRGVEIVNVNTPEGTALKHFPIKSYEEVFGA